MVTANSNINGDDDDDNDDDHNINKKKKKKKKHGVGTKAKYNPRVQDFKKSLHKRAPLQFSYVPSSTHPT